MTVVGLQWRDSSEFPHDSLLISRGENLNGCIFQRTFSAAKVVLFFNVCLLIKVNLEINIDLLVLILDKVKKCAF